MPTSRYSFYFYILMFFVNLKLNYSFGVVQNFVNLIDTNCCFLKPTLINWRKEYDIQDIIDTRLDKKKDKYQIVWVKFDEWESVVLAKLWLLKINVYDNQIIVGEVWDSFGLILFDRNYSNEQLYEISSSVFYFLLLLTMKWFHWIYMDMKVQCQDFKLSRQKESSDYNKN